MAYEWWRQLPQHIDPIAFSIGFFEVRWYSVFLLLAFGLGAAFLWWRIRRGEMTLPGALLWDAYVWTVLGALIGGRLGFVILYAPGYFYGEVSRVLLPLGNGGEWVGLYGMSFFGALLGGLATLALFARIQKVSFLELADVLVPILPLGIFLGRIGNFMNGELLGRPTDRAVGMDFGDGMLRYPSTIFEALFEGALLFIFFFFLRKRVRFHGELLLSFLVAYSILRFFLEFFREPDAWIGLLSGFSLGQWYSLLGLLLGIIGYFFLRSRNKGSI